MTIWYVIDHCCNTYGKVIFFQRRVILKNVAKNTTSVLIDVDVPEMLPYFLFKPSPDRRYTLAAKEYIRVYRYSFLSRYSVYDFQENKKIDLSVDGGKNYFHYVVWNPVTNGLLLSYRYNLYYMASPESPAIQLTSDVQPTIFNGISDWVYEEEIFANHIVSWFSPDGKTLAYIRFDESKVPNIGIPVYGTAGDIRNRYPEIRGIPYPKAGAPNPIVTLHTINLENLSPTKPAKINSIAVPAELASRNHLITFVQWANNDELITSWMNRVQNVAYLQKCVVKTENCTIVSIDVNYSVGKNISNIFSS